MNCQVQNARQQLTLGPARESLGIDLDGRELSAATLQCARPLLLDSLVTLKDNLFIRWLAVYLIAAQSVFNARKNSTQPPRKQTFELSSSFTGAFTKSARE
jgi:hypothetical protein